MKKLVVLLILVPLLAVALAPAYVQPADDAAGQYAPADASGQLVAITSSFYHPDRDPSWTSAPYSHTVACALPSALPASADSRAPPAQDTFLL